MQSLKHRLESGAATLALIDRRRAETGLSQLGCNLERIVIDRELSDLGQVACPDPCSQQPISEPQPASVRVRNRR